MPEATWFNAVAGLLRHAPEITAVTNQTVNSYRRLLAAHEATVGDLNAVVLGHGLELRANPFMLRRLWGPAGEEVQQFLRLLRAGLLGLGLTVIVAVGSR